jgi:adenosine deaminase
MIVDLHRHHGGSLTPKWVWETLQRQSKQYWECQVEARMTFKHGGQMTFQNFLSKFSILDEIIWDEEIIRDSIGNVCWGIKSERIQYAELKVSIHKFMRHTKLPPADIIRIIREKLDEDCEKWGIGVGLVLSIKYEADRDEQRKIASLITDKASSFLVGIDFVGDEFHYNPDFYEGICRDWKSAGKGIEAHVGESQTHENVRSAIERLKVDRIAHGVRAVDHPDIIKLAADHNVCFDMALTSNYRTGVADYQTHPIRKLLENRIVPVTLGTDDPVVLGTTLGNEYALAKKYYNLSDDDITWMMFNSIRFAFGWKMMTNRILMQD